MPSSPTDRPAFLEQETLRTSSDPRRILHHLATVPALALACVLFCVGALSASARPWASMAVTVVVALLCLWRVWMLPEERPIWLLLGCALGSLSGARAYLVLVSSTSGTVVSVPVELMCLSFYPLACAAVWQLARRRTSVLGDRRLDGLCSFLMVAAVATAVVAAPLSRLHIHSFPEAALTLAFPLADVALLGLLAALVAMAGWPAGRSSRFMLVGLACFAASDLFAVSVGTGRLTDAGWSLAALLLAFSSWLRGDFSRRVRTDEARGHPLLPLTVCATANGALLLYSLEMAAVSPVEVGLIVAALACGVVRTWQAFGEARVLTRQVTEDALTDALTRLPNRRQLLFDLERAFASMTSSAAEHYAAFVMYDLNGFKAYNDTFGHPAGDELLRRLARSLAATVQGHASAYRLGGDEFCVLVAAAANLQYVLRKTCAALSESGEGYHITVAHGVALIPQEASTISEAMHFADMRMYAQKAGGRTSIGAQMRDILLCTLAERSKALGHHNDDVALIARDIARKLGLTAEQVDEVVRAAELHDVGKLAIPDHILLKPGPLSPEEWETMRLHTIVGQRILAAAPALAPVGKLVRSSHERWDGAGYPDQLAGEQIPLGARIVATCDAYDAMVTDRVYSKARSHADALAELRRCSGTQFDPTVIAAFLELMDAPTPSIAWASGTSLEPRLAA